MKLYQAKLLLNEQIETVLLTKTSRKEIENSNI